MASAAGKSQFQGLIRLLKKPWEITGPYALPEYRMQRDPGRARSSTAASTSGARPTCGTIATGPIVPTPPTRDTVYDVKYYTRDRRRDLPPLRRTLLLRPGLGRYMAHGCPNSSSIDPVKDSLQPYYVNTTVEEDDNAIDGGYQK